MPSRTRAPAPVQSPPQPSGGQVPELAPRGNQAAAQELPEQAAEPSTLQMAADEVDAEAQVPALQNQAYAHGGYMGLALALLRDETWSAVLQRLDPPAWREVAALGGAKAIMERLENHPVLAAYGTVRSGATAPGASPVPLEWDVFIDPNVPASLSRARIAHGSAALTVVAGVTREPGLRLDVQGDPHVLEWVDLFGRALVLGGGQSLVRGWEPSDADVSAEVAAGNALEVLGSSGVVLDVKSTWSTPADVALFVQALERSGVPVVAVGTFVASQTSGLPAAKSVRFFHTLHGLINACEDGTVAPRTRVMFNGGCLLADDGAGGWRADPTGLATLDRLTAAFDFSLGLYVQEYDASPSAVTALTQMVDSRPDLFPDGFAWGGASGAAEKGITGSGIGSQSSLQPMDEAEVAVNAVRATLVSALVAVNQVVEGRVVPFLEGVLDVLAQQLFGLARTRGGVEAAVGELDALMSELAARLGALRARVQGLSDRVEALRLAVAALSAEVEAQRAAMDANASEIDRQAAALEELDHALDALIQQQARAQELADENGAALDAQAESLDALEAEGEAADRVRADLGARADEIDERIRRMSEPGPSMDDLAEGIRLQEALLDALLRGEDGDAEAEALERWSEAQRRASGSAPGR